MHSATAVVDNFLYFWSTFACRAALKTFFEIIIIRVVFNGGVNAVDMSFVEKKIYEGSQNPDIIK